MKLRLAPHLLGVCSYRVHAFCDSILVQVQVGDEAGGGAGEDEDVVFGEVSGEGVGVGEASEDHVGGGVVDGDVGDGGEAVGEGLGEGVVIGEAVDMIFECVDAGGGELAGLAEATADDFAPAAGLVDEICGADEEGADGGAEALGEAKGDGVEGGGDRGGGIAGGDGGVEEAGAVEVEVEIVFVDEIAGGLEVGQREDAAVGSIFEAKEAGAGVVEVIGFDEAFDFVEVEGAIGFDGEGLGLDATEGGATSAFVEVGVGGLADDVFVAAGTVGEEGDEVGLGTTGGEEGGFFSEGAGGEGFEFLGGGIVVEDVIADFGFGHGLAHGGAGAGDGIGAEVDGV